MSHSSLLSSQGPEIELDKIASLKDNEISLGDTALLLAVLDNPLVSIRRYERHMCKLSADVEKAYANNNNTNDNDTIDDNGESKSKQQSTVEDFSNVIPFI